MRMEVSILLLMPPENPRLESSNREPKNDSEAVRLVADFVCPLLISAVALAQEKLEELIRADYANGLSYRMLAVKYRKSFSQLSRILSTDKQTILDRLE